MLLCAAAAFSIGRADVLFNPKYIDTRLAGGANSTPINITPFFNNQAFGNGIADFDGHSRTFPNDVLPPSTFTYAGVNFSLPIPPAGGMDNVKAQGQGIDVPVGHYQSVYMLAASDADVAVTSIRAQYADEMSSLGEFLVPSWWNWPYPAGGDLIFPYHWDDGAQNYNQSMIYLVQAYVDSTRLLTTLFLPELSNLHVFALSLVSAPYAAGPQLAVQYAATTSQWFEGTNKTQIVEVVVSNVGKEWVLANNSVSVSVKADGLETKIPGE